MFMPYFVRMFMLPSGVINNNNILFE